MHNIDSTSRAEAADSLGNNNIDIFSMESHDVSSQSGLKLVHVIV